MESQKNGIYITNRNSTAGRKAHPEISKENAEHRGFLKEKERQLTSPQKQRNQKTAGLLSKVLQENKCQPKTRALDINFKSDGKIKMRPNIQKRRYLSAENIKENKKGET